MLRAVCAVYVGGCGWMEGLVDGWLVWELERGWRLGGAMGRGSRSSRGKSCALRPATCTPCGSSLALLADPTPLPSRLTRSRCAALCQVASLCAHNVVGSNIPCCGMAGDRGLRYPELTAASLQHLNVQVWP